MPEPARCLNVLLVEDSESDARLILQRIAQAGYRTVHERVENAEQLARTLKEGQWNVVLSDHSLPEFNAADALLMLQRSGMDLPFIVVSGAIGEETAVALMKAGAHDYVMKTNLARLVPAIEREIEEARVRREKLEAEEKVRTSLREKEIMLKEIHHRVKNNLQIMTSILNLQQHRIADTGMQELFAAAQRRIRSMALVHENLYHSSDLAAIAMEDYVRSIAEELLRAVGKPDVVIIPTITDVYMGVDHAIPCGLILNELLTNSLKHGFPGGRAGEIAISVTLEKPDAYMLVVRDDGVGFPTTFDMKHPDTLGMQIIGSLVEQLEGSIETMNDGGAMTVVRFPAV